MKTKISLQLHRSGERTLSQIVWVSLAALWWLASARMLPAQVTIPANEPTDETNCLGGCLTYSVNATGKPPLSYEWRIYSGTAYRVVESEIAGSLVLCHLPTNNDRVRVVVTDGDGLSASSRFARLQIIEPPMILRQPGDASAVLGESFSLEVMPAGTSVSHQWYFDGRPLPGKTSNRLTFSSFQRTNAGDYVVVLSNACGLASTSPAHVTAVEDTTFTRITTGPLATDLGNSVTASVGDYDGDNYQDVLVARLNMGAATLYHNNGNGTFSSVTNEVFPFAREYNGYGAIWADLDNDGRPDLIGLDYYGSHPCFLAFNNGNGSFTKVGFGTQSAWSVNPLDYDGDGLLDLYLVGSWPPPLTTNHLYRNLDGRSFQLMPRAELGDLFNRPPGVSATSWADYDGDGAMDAFVASTTNYNRCQMFHNDGRGHLTSVTNQVTLDAINSISAAWGDYDNDGRLDLCVVAFAWSDFSGWTSFIYRNLGGSQFERAPIGLTVPSGSTAAWGDYDNDGFLDLLMTKARDIGCLLFRNNGNGTFSRITHGRLVTDVPPELGCFSANWFDYDNDGFLDALVANGSDLGTAVMANFLYHNDRNANAWLKVKLVGVLSNRDAIGAKVWVKASLAGATRWLRRDIAAGDTWTGNNNPIAHFGLRDATNAEVVRVEWPSGQVTELHDVAVRRSLIITEAPGLRATWLPQGAMQMQLTAHPGMSTALDVSSNFVDWVPWQTQPQTERTITVTDPEAGQHAQGFYKARVVR